MKPIIFSTDMVRAILDGRKTQTRRVIKPQPDNVPEGAYIDPYNYNYNSFTVWTSDNKMCLHCGGDRRNTAHWKAPYKPGQKLWVRETWMPETEQGIPTGGYIYRASSNKPEPDGRVSLKWRPSIHMPKEAARIFLLVTNVLVERLQEITTEDATAEGCYCVYESAIPFQRLKGQSFEATWDSMYAKKGYSWGSNPWVWVIEFERTEEPS